MKWWPFRHPKPVRNFSDDLLAASATPRISVAEHLQARSRVEFQMRQHMIVDIGNGPERWNTGCIDTDDLRKVHGYHFRIGGYDRFGWPDGHPDSPAGTTAPTLGR